MKKRLVSGITATGKLTIGNYIGAIKNFVELQDKYEMFIFVADLHALTTDITPEELDQNRKEMFALYLAAGLDPHKTTLFFQSEVLEHGYMNWLMESRTTMGELERMTQFKDKSLKSKQNNGTTKIKTTLLTYPALMSGDILLYDAEIVPTGKDQKQHIELTRNIAERFNNQYGETFKIPETFFPKIGAKIMSLQDPTSKMSKSDHNKKASIFLLEDPEHAFNKIKKAVTDSENKVYISDDKPGVTNLLTIFASLKGISLEEAEKHFKDANYGELKVTTGELVKDFLMDLQVKYKEAISNIDKAAKIGRDRAQKIASNKIKEIKSKIGL